MNVYSNRNEDVFLSSFFFHFALALFYGLAFSLSSIRLRSIHTRLSPLSPGPPFTFALTRHGQARRIDSVPRRHGQTVTSTLDHGHACLFDVVKCHLPSFPFILPSFPYFPGFVPRQFAVGPSALSPPCTLH